LEPGRRGLDFGAHLSIRCKGDRFVEIMTLESINAIFSDLKAGRIKGRMVLDIDGGANKSA
jgi:D-arabinose 1-dehydrogenase-like Zn-dependent alcohol dehydrogenase